MRGFTLRIIELQESDRGDYTCIVSNAYGSINWTYTVDVHGELPVLHLRVCLYSALCVPLQSALQYPCPVDIADP